MKLVKKSRLAFTEGNSDKVYEVDLCELASRKDERYLVNFRYGKRGNKLREGTKTSAPVELEAAEKLFDSVVISKTNKGYYDGTTPTPESSSISSDAPTTSLKLIEQMLKSLKKERSSKRRSRIIWRLGELGDEATGAEIAVFIKRGDWLEDYSIAWALGRLQAKNQLADIEVLLKSKNKHVCNIAFESKLLLSDKASREQLLADTLQSIPSALREAILSAGTDPCNINVQQRLSAIFSQPKTDANTLLPDCYRLSLIYPSLYHALLVQLQTQVFAPGSFRGIRALYKASELRLDFAMFGLLTQRIESTQSFFNCYDYDWASLPDGGYVTPSEELKQANSRLAYSNKTRDYLRRRSWRSIYRLGTAGDLRYVDMATHMLLAIRDEHANQTRNAQVYRWQQNGGSWQNVLISSKHYDIFASFLSFNHILFENSEQYRLAPSARAWEKTQEQDTLETQRTECFAHLWDQKPENALLLLKQSLCGPVHVFARKVLESNNSYITTLTTSDIEALLCSPYDSTCQLALGIVKDRLKQDDALLETSLLLALLRSILKDARDLGLECLPRVSVTSNDIDTVIELLLIQHSDVRIALLDYVNALDFVSNHQETLLHTMIDKVFKLTGDLDEAHMNSLADFALNTLSQATQNTALTLIERLLASECSAKQLFGAHLLVGHKIDFGDIPQKMLEHINNSSSEAVRGMAAALLGKQTDDALAQQTPLLVSLYAQGDAHERASLLKILQRLASANIQWSTTIMQAMLSLIFTKEEKEGQREELESFFEQHLQEATTKLDKDIVWRLLQAKSATAQSIGARILLPRNYLDFSVKQWALFARNPSLHVRQYAFSAYKNNIDLCKRYSKDALRILDNNWQDSRDFGFQYFTEHYTEHDWDPETIVYLCDSVREDVQNYGREVLQRFFNEADGSEYLTKLSQHPSSNVQLFVSNFLDDHASDQPEKILSLRYYFLSVLSQVNRGRICKDRVVAFMLREASKDQKVAQLSAEIFTRISLTVVHKDKSSLIKAMMQLQKQHPELALPIATKKPAIKMSA